MLVTDKIKQSPDNIYLNLSIVPTDQFISLTGEVARNPDPVSVPCSFDETLTVNLLQDTTDYYASVIRFNIPTSDIPLFIMPIDNYSPDPNLSLLNIGVIYNNFVSIQIIEYVPNNNFTPPTPRGSFPFFSVQELTSPYYYVFSFQQLLNMINSSLAAAYLAAGGPGNAPYYTFNSSTSLLSLVISSTFIANGGKIFMNAYTKTYLSSFQFRINEGFTTAGNTVTYYHVLTPASGMIPDGSGNYTFVEEYPSLSQWLDLRKIVLTTGSIPVTQEASPTNLLTGKSNGAANYQPIISDFIVNFESSFEIGTNAVYNPTSQYRLIDLAPSTLGQRIQINCFWQDKLGRLNQIYIPPNSSASVKIGFFKKSLYKCGCSSAKKM